MGDYREQGFTLIELLTSIVIAALIAAAGIPQDKEYKAKAYDSVALSTIRQLQVATEAIADKVERGEAGVPMGAPDYAYIKEPGVPGRDAGDLDVTTTATERMSDYMEIVDDRLFAVGGYQTDFWASLGKPPERVFYAFHCEGTTFFQSFEFFLPDGSGGWRSWNINQNVPLTENTRSAYGC